jgi:hypothetical protein
MQALIQVKIKAHLGRWAHSTIRKERSLNLCDIHSLRPLAALFDVELDPLSLGEGLETFGAYRRIVNKNIRSVILLDKTIPFFFIKPFNRSFYRHTAHSSLYLLKQIIPLQKTGYHYIPCGFVIVKIHVIEGATNSRPAEKPYRLSHSFKVNLSIKTRSEWPFIRDTDNRDGKRVYESARQIPFTRDRHYRFRLNVGDDFSGKVPSRRNREVKLILIGYFYEVPYLTPAAPLTVINIMGKPYGALIYTEGNGEAAIKSPLSSFFLPEQAGCLRG